ncbi:MAG: hypothetical protein EZS28_041515 [Streblomastix strix]|uniref:Uncharacterized protein n=1 Tax=Streblomastix strix TaxID=222440 RepID=A0A5J4TXX8_9EUKA|nr:MAG: hypothetical protein EZS28_041515 [Streblomastix strix]
MRFTSCPKALEAMIKSKELAKYEKDNEQWITQLQKILKSNDSGWDFFAILDSLVCLKQIGYPLPEGMSEDLYNKAEKGRDDYFNFVLHFIDNQWCDVASGFFFNEVSPIQLYSI